MDEKQPCFVVGISKLPKRPFGGEDLVCPTVGERTWERRAHICRDTDRDQDGQAHRSTGCSGPHVEKI